MKSVTYLCMETHVTVHHLKENARKAAISTCRTGGISWRFFYKKEKSIKTKYDTLLKEIHKIISELD